MARGHLGLFNTPVDQRHIRLCFGIFCIQLAVFAAVAPLRNVPLTPVMAFVPMVDSIQFVNEVIIGVLLYAQATVLRSRALMVLASGYVLAALLLIPHALSFPGAFGPHGLVGGGVSTTGWLAISRRFVFPATVLCYLILKRADANAEAERTAPRIVLWLLGAAAIAGGITGMVTVGHDLLPTIFLNTRESIAENLLVLTTTLALFTMVVTYLMMRQTKSVLDLWLLVAMFSWMSQGVPLHARFTVGWYYLFGALVTSNLIVMIALLAESNRLYVRLALAMSARDRERESRLLSMDVVAAAIAHEVGQPLAGATLSAASCVKSLGAEPCDAEGALGSARATLDGVRLAFDAIKSVQAMYSTGPSRRVPLDLNDLVVETASAMDLEFVAHRVALEVDLDHQLPVIVANPLQIRRILVNLLTNSLESLDETTRRQRKISIRTAKGPDDQVLLEVSDTGVGIPADKLRQIFEPFVTTKESGMGLGLSLSRMIVEEHGGQLWASPRDRHGATFHMQMPSGAAA